MTLSNNDLLRDINELKLATESVDNAFQELDAVQRLRSKINSDQQLSEMECKLAYESIRIIGRNFNIESFPAWKGSPLSTERIASSSIRLSIEEASEGVFARIAKWISEAVKWIVDKIRSIFQKKIPDTLEAQAKEADKTIDEIKKTEQTFKESPKAASGIELKLETAHSRLVRGWVDKRKLKLEDGKFLDEIASMGQDTSLAVTGIWDALSLQFVIVLETIRAIYDLQSSQNVSLDDVTANYKKMSNEIEEVWGSLAESKVFSEYKGSDDIKRSKSYYNIGSSKLLDESFLLVEIRKNDGSENMRKLIREYGYGKVTTVKRPDNGEHRDAYETNIVCLNDPLELAKSIAERIKHSFDNIDKGFREIKRQSDKDAKKMDQIDKMIKSYISTIPKNNTDQRKEVSHETLDILRATITNYRSAITELAKYVMAYGHVSTALMGLVKEIHQECRAAASK